MQAIKTVAARLLGRKPDKHRLLTVLEQLNARFPADLARIKEHVANSFAFNVIIGVLIVISTVMIGIEVDNSKGTKLEDNMGFFALDLVLALAFFVEMLVRLNQLGWDYFADAWNILDYSLVVLNCADIVVAINSNTSTNVKVASTLRVFRLFRIVRYIKGLKIFYALWMILQAFLDSIRTMFWVSLLILIIVYCVAVSLVEFVGDADDLHERWGDAEQYIGSVPKAMWTVFQIVTLDRWADVARPMGKIDWMAMVLVIAAIVICSFGALNLIIAIMVQRLQTIVASSEEMTGKALRKTEQMLLASMGEDFRGADCDESGELEYEEFQRLIRTPALLQKLHLLGFHVDEAENLFELMDADHSGTVSAEEFITGLQKLKDVAKGQDVVQLICFAQRQVRMAMSFVDRVRKLNEQADEMQDQLDGIGKGITHEMKGRVHAEARNDGVWQRAAERQMMIGRLDKNRQVEFPVLRGQR